jgi:hypothetical protein
LIVRMAFGLLPTHPNPKERGLVAIDLSGVLRVIGKGLDEAEQ